MGHPQSVGGTALTETAVGAIRTNSDNGGMLTMTEPQVWTLIGVFAASLSAVIGLTVGLVLRVVTTEINSLRNEMNVRFDHLDRNVQALTRHVFGDR